MLNLFQGPAVSRRAFLRVGSLGLGGLTLADLLRSRAAGNAGGASSTKSVIMVYLPGGPSHLDMYDPKPDAPAEIRGEFRSIGTSVPGLRLCELFPMQARIADKLAVIRGFHTLGGSHDGKELSTGFPRNILRPAIGSVVSRLSRERQHGLPPYVTLITDEQNYSFFQDPAYLGPAHRPLTIRGEAGVANLALVRGMTLDRQDDRAGLLRHFDSMRRDLDLRRDAAGMDSFTAQALEMVTSNSTRDAFDLDREAPAVRDRYGRNPASQQFLLARRLVEAGVRFVTLSGGWLEEGRSPCNVQNWDTHGDNFPRLRVQLPPLDRAVHALVCDLHERGLDRDVAVIVCGEMGRAPRVGLPNDGGNATATGRDHWPTGFALVAGGGLRMGQVVGATDRRGERPLGRPIVPQNLLATIYHVLGIDVALTFPDYRGRPQYLLDDREKINELL